MKGKDSFWSFISSNIISLSTVLAGVIVLILQVIGLVNSNQITIAILALVLLLATSEIVDKSRKLDRIETLISESTKTIDIQKLTIVDQGLDYLAIRIRNARSSIDHVAFADHTPLWLRKTDKYEKAIREILRGNRVRYRYIGYLEKEAHRINRIVEVLQDKTISLYFPAYYKQCEEAYPAFSFIIFDEKEVVVYYPQVIGESETSLLIRQQDIVQMYINYFRCIWASARKLNLEQAKQLQQEILSR